MGSSTRFKEDLDANRWNVILNEASDCTVIVRTNIFCQINLAEAVKTTLIVDSSTSFKIVTSNLVNCTLIHVNRDNFTPMIMMGKRRELPFYSYTTCKKENKFFKAFKEYIREADRKLIRLRQQYVGENTNRFRMFEANKH